MADYNGPERRHGERRITPDRRAEVRWEPGKDDRRQNPGRRKTDFDPTFWNGRDSEKQWPHSADMKEATLWPPVRLRLPLLARGHYGRV